MLTEPSSMSGKRPHYKDKCWQQCTRPEHEAAHKMTSVRYMYSRPLKTTVAKLRLCALRVLAVITQAGGEGDREASSPKPDFLSTCYKYRSGQNVKCPPPQEYQATTISPHTRTAHTKGNHFNVSCFQSSRHWKLFVCYLILLLLQISAHTHTRTHKHTLTHRHTHTDRLTLTHRHTHTHTHGGALSR